VEGDNKPSALWKLITGNYEISRLFFCNHLDCFLADSSSDWAEHKLATPQPFDISIHLFGQNMKRAFLYSLHTDWPLFWRLHHACAAATPPQPLPIKDAHQTIINL
jgi:hypothetical protein